MERRLKNPKIKRRLCFGEDVENIDPCRKNLDDSRDNENQGSKSNESRTVRVSSSSKENKVRSLRDSSCTQCINSPKSTTKEEHIMTLSRLRYKLRDQSVAKKKVNYCESDADPEDFSPDCSEYFPSPEARKNGSVCSSLGGDSVCIENLLVEEPIVQSPSAISNLSVLLDVNFVASSTVIYKKIDDSLSTLEQRNEFPILDITLKPSKLGDSETTDNRLEPVNSEFVLTEEVNKTLTPNHVLEPTTETEICNKNSHSDTVETIFGKTLTSKDNFHTVRSDVCGSQEVEIVKSPDEDVKDKMSYEIQIIIEPYDNDDDEIEVVPPNQNIMKDNELSFKELENKRTDETEFEHATFNQNTLEYTELNNSQQKDTSSHNIESVTVSETPEVDEIANIDVPVLDSEDPLDLSNESRVYEPEIDSEGGDQDKTIGIQVEVVHLEASASDNDIVEEYSSENNSEECSMSRKLTRKRKRNVDEWIDFKNKRLKNSGEAYEGARSKIKYSKKIMLPACNCKKKCGQKFTEVQRQSIFSKYYKLADHELQWQYINRHVTTRDIKKMTLDRKNNRTQTIKYFFSLNKEAVEVCKIFFLNTLNISERIVYTALEKTKSDESLIDQRGLHQNRPRKMSEETENSIIKHINMFPAVESHYVRKESKRQYLSELLNISKMYRLYKIWYGEQNNDPSKMGSKRQYETIFNTKFNYSFYKPKKDQCALCAKYNQSDFSYKASMQEEYENHLRRKDRVRQIKNNEKETAGENSTYIVAIYDLQKVINIPRSDVTTFHYKRKYPVYNFTIFDAIQKQGYCYVWHSQIAKKGCTEIGSCILQFMTTMKQKGITTIIFYSDGCYGQNKNRYIFALYLYAAQKLGLDITHRFFVTGHSQNEGDSMHACIERNMKNKIVFTPDQVYGLIMNAKQTGKRYELKEMNQNEILNIKSLVDSKYWQKDRNGNKIRWSDVMEVSVTNSNPYCLLFKYDFDENYSEMDSKPPPPQVRARGRGRGRGGRRPQLNPQQRPMANLLKPAYDDLLPVKKELYDDLHSLCTSEAIPRYYHGFYESLRPESSTNTVNYDDSD